MQYLEGETLADRLATGALPLDHALKTAIEIASALVQAHRAGIVHRDLKPGNIMLTKAGAKLLDFGLAKASAPVVSGGALSLLPTTPPNLTAQGTILGTFQYMAPEQIEGPEADARTDIFAIRCGAVRDAHRAPGVRGQDACEPARGDLERRAPAGVTDATGRTRDTRSHHQHMSRQGSGRPLPDHTRSVTRHQVGGSRLERC